MNSSIVHSGPRTDQLLTSRGSPTPFLRPKVVRNAIKYLLNLLNICPRREVDDDEGWDRARKVGAIVYVEVDPGLAKSNGHAPELLRGNDHVRACSSVCGHL